jgi:hypothetical protein
VTDSDLLRTPLPGVMLARIRVGVWDPAARPVGTSIKPRRSACSRRAGGRPAKASSGRALARTTSGDIAGRSATWHTDASGYADVCFHAPADVAGETITAHVGGASCHATL